MLLFKRSHNFPSPLAVLYSICLLALSFHLAAARTDTQDIRDTRGCRQIARRRRKSK